MGIQMEYFTHGTRPFLLQFPPCIGRIVTTEMLFKGNDCSAWEEKDGLIQPPPGVVSLIADALCPKVKTKGLLAGVPIDDMVRDIPTTSIKPGYGGLGSFVQSRQSSTSSSNAAKEKAPEQLHKAFVLEEVQDFDPGRFENVRKLQDATRNKGQVHLMKDVQNDDRLVAVKRMPNSWICTSHSEFVQRYPSESELPWQDIGCSQFLTESGYQFGCDLVGVFRSPEFTDVVTEFAEEGDLFLWCGKVEGLSIGPEREAAVLPLAIQIMQGVRELHEMSIVHRDLSLENILMSKGDATSSPKIRLIDYGMTSTSRNFQNSVRGKVSYQAPEIHTDKEYDGFLTDAFAVGVALYSIILKDYPWLSTRPGSCKCFDYVQKYGFRKYLAKRKVRTGELRANGGELRGPVSKVLSEPVIQLLEGLLELDPAKRLSLGEANLGGVLRKSVWDELWLQQ